MYSRSAYSKLQYSRPFGAVEQVNISYDALREIVSADLFNADGLRVSIREYVYDHDMLRILQADDIFTADTLRVIYAAQEYPADIMRRIAKEYVESYDLLRILMYMVDLQRQKQKEYDHLSDTLRYDYPADTVRVVQREYDSEYDTWRFIVEVYSEEFDTDRFIQYFVGYWPTDVLRTVWDTQEAIFDTEREIFMTPRYLDKNMIGGKRYIPIITRRKDNT